MKDLTTEQISSIWHAQAASGGRSFEDIVRAAIKADRELNGRTVEPSEQANVQDDGGLCERICAAIKAADDKSVDESGYMLDSNDCIKIVRECFATTPAQPAREWVGLTDEERDTIYHNNEPYADLRAVETLLREKNAKQPAADDKAGGEPVTGRDLFVAWWDGYGMQPGVECSLPVWRYQETAIQSAWNHVATRYYTNPHTQAEVRVPDGYALVPVEPTLEMGWAYLDAANACSPDKEHSFNHAGYRAMLASAPKPQDDLPAIRKKQAS